MVEHCESIDGPLVVRRRAGFQKRRPSMSQKG
jgi:hypothetical protein